MFTGSGLNFNAIRVFYFVFLSLIFIITPSGYAFADTLIGDYVKDHRDLDEIGLVCTLEARKKTGGLVYIKITAANPALCGGEWEWEVPLKGNRAEIRDGSRHLNIRFQKDKVTVDGKPLENDHCPLTGTYIPYGAMVKSTAEVIKDIRRHFTHINENQETYDLDEKELIGFSTEGGRCKIYSYMGHPKKIVVEHFGEMGKIMESYYYFSGNLLFCFRQTLQYDKPFGQVVRRLEDRFYFHYDRMIRWIGNDKKEVPLQSPGYQAEQENVFLSAARWAGLLEKSEKTINRDDLGDL